MDNSSSLDLKELVKTLGYDPMRIGAKVLESLGYKVDTCGYGYNSVRIIVEDPSGKTVCDYSIGD